MRERRVGRKVPPWQVYVPRQVPVRERVVWEALPAFRGWRWELKVQASILRRGAQPQVVAMGVAKVLVPMKEPL